MKTSDSPQLVITWSPRQARELGIDPEAGLKRCLELLVKIVRLFFLIGHF